MHIPALTAPTWGNKSMPKSMPLWVHGASYVHQWGQLHALETALCATHKCMCSQLRGLGFYLL